MFTRGYVAKMMFKTPQKMGAQEMRTSPFTRFPVRDLKMLNFGVQHFCNTGMWKASWCVLFIYIYIYVYVNIIIIIIIIIINIINNNNININIYI